VDRTIRCNSHGIVFVIAMYFIAAHGRDGSVVFSFFLCEHDNSRTAALGVMKCCMNMYLDDL